MSNIAYAGHGAEIEEDAARLSRRKLEFEHDAARRSEPRPRRRWARGPVSAMSAVVASRPEVIAGRRAAATPSGTDDPVETGVKRIARETDG